MDPRTKVSAAIFVGLLINVIGTPALACRIQRTLDLESIRHADLVVIGRVSDYEIVPDPRATRQCRRRLLADWNLFGAVREVFGGQTCRSPSHARFRITVSATLLGQAPSPLVAELWPTAFGLPETLAPVPHLIALHHGDVDGERVPSVLRAPCSSAFIVPPNGAQATAVRRLLRSGPPVLD